MTKPVVFTQSGSELVHNAGTPLTLKGVVVEGLPSVPFSFSALGQGDKDGVISGLSQILPISLQLPAEILETEVKGFLVYLDTQRGTYWGDIVISVDAPLIYDVDIKLETLDVTQCNSLVSLILNGTVEPDTEYSFTITATGGDFSISRTATIITLPAAP
tara:strand:- start:14 stop:493 length:480 start_codon:yes stop_codon:yes gene_type:complete